MIPALLKRSILALAGAKHAIIHLYAATSPLFRNVVFRTSKEETIRRHVEAVKLMRELTDQIEHEQGTVYQVIVFSLMIFRIILNHLPVELLS